MSREKRRYVTPTMEILAEDNVRSAQIYLRESMKRIGELSDLFSCMPGSDKSRQLKIELNKIFDVLPVALNKVVYEIKKLDNGFIYNWSFEVSVPKSNMTDGIRRSTDVASIKFLLAPDESENPLTYGFITSTDFSLTSLSSMKDGLIIEINPHHLKWNNN